MREILIDRVYRHFKGDHYLVVGIAKDSETGEEMVVYRLASRQWDSLSTV